MKQETDSNPNFKTLDNHLPYASIFEFLIFHYRKMNVGSKMKLSITFELIFMMIHVLLNFDNS